MFDVLAISTVRSSSERPVRGSSSVAISCEHVRELVAALAAAHVDDHVGVAPLGDLLQQHGLAGAEAARHGGGRPARDREQQVERALAGAERHRGRRARMPRRPRPAQRPAVREPQLAPVDRRRSARSTVYSPSSATHSTVPPTSGGASTRASIAARLAAPRRGSRRRPTRVARPTRAGAKCQRRSGASVGARAPGPSRSPSFAEPAQHAVEDAAEQPGSELRAQRAAARAPRARPARGRPCTRGPARRRVAAQRDHLARQALLAELDEVEQARARRSPSTSTTGPLTRTIVAAAHAHSRCERGPRSSTQRSASAVSV